MIPGQGNMNPDNSYAQQQQQQQQQQHQQQQYARRAEEYRFYNAQGIQQQGQMGQVHQAIVQPPVQVLQRVPQGMQPQPYPMQQFVEVHQGHQYLPVGVVQAAHQPQAVIHQMPGHAMQMQFFRPSSPGTVQQPQQQGVASGPGGSAVVAAAAGGGMHIQYADMSPSMARMQVGGSGAGGGAGSGGALAYPLSAGATTPTSPSLAPAYEPGQQSADREEELLLNLLIARRQRGRIEGSGRGQPSLGKELMRMRQQQQQQQQIRQRSHPNMPQVPGMPPLVEGLGGPSVGMQYPQSGMQTQQHHLHSPYQNVQEIHERIDRSPGRSGVMLDARIPPQEMLDFSGRGGGGGGAGGQPFHPGMKRGFPFLASLPFGQYPMGSADLLAPDMPKKKRKHKKKPADMPRRPLSAYNLFFSEERERILKEIGGDAGGGDVEGDEAKEGSAELKEDGTGDADGGVAADATAAKDEEKQSEEGEGDESASPKPKAFSRPLIPSEKKRRPHRKTHGKISFQELARMVGDRWKNLPEERRQYYQDLAKEDMKRQKAAMEEYYAKQSASKRAKVEKDEGNEDDDDEVEEDAALKGSDDDDDGVEAEEVEGEDGEEDPAISDSSPSAEDATKHAIQA